MDSLAEKHKREIDELRGGKGGALKWAVVVAALVLIASVFLFRSDTSQLRGGISDAHRELLASGASWAEDIIDQQSQFRTWLESHGTSIEIALFDRASLKILNSAADIASDGRGGESGGFFQRTYISLHFAFGRIVFLLIASLRLWIFAGVTAVLWASRKYLRHQGPDILGQTGNGRLYYSGIRAALDTVDQRGVPQTLVTGLACLPSLPASVARSSEIGRVLSHFGAINGTTTALAGIIIAHRHYPSYVAMRDEISLLDKAYQGSSLAENAAHVLMNVLELHREYREGRALDEAAPAVLVPVTIEAGKAINSETYSAWLQHGLHRVLTPALRRELATLSVVEVATATLALEAGKAMTYALEAGRWVRRSNFHQLNARAVLHSIAAFGQEFDAASRDTIRRAVVFASRSSVFAPVRFPLDLSETSRALRQWTELLLACPHELQTAADEVELFGLVTELHRRWIIRFFDSILTARPGDLDGIFATTGNLLLVPVRRILDQFHDLIDAATLKRLEELVLVVSQKQKLHSLTVDSSIDADHKEEVSVSERFLGPLAAQEMTQLAERHDLRVDELRAWSAIRVILNSYAWLARRVGDYSVPLSSVIFSVLEPFNDSNLKTNEFGLAGKKAMVPLRATKILERFGRGWQSYFTEVLNATMAETSEEFERRLKRIDDTPTRDNEDDSVNA